MTSNNEKLWPVYVPSKGRPDSKLIAKYGNRVTPVVEQQEANSYCPKASCIVMMKNDQGIAYVRNLILANARERGFDWFWMLDDDIVDFYIKSKKVDMPEALLTAQAIIETQTNIGQAALEYQQFAWAAKKDYNINGYCDVAVAINVEATKRLSYRAEANLKEDRDFTLQVLCSGRKTLRVQVVGFRAPANGSNKGGLSEIYAQPGREIKAVDKMVELWPGIVRKQVKPNGRIDCKINWRAFK